MLKNNHTFLEESKIVVVLRSQFLCFCNQNINCRAPLCHVKCDDKQRSIQLSHTESIKLQKHDYDVLRHFIKDCQGEEYLTH
ncbi:hypothetical protein ACQEXU_01745 [Vibrio sp. TRT 21S02]|uniref:hypothetical protein n=1 Tax=Vibrio sp. TRT 21S02 TaxID=3418507 RepID=UPI003CED8442